MKIAVLGAGAIGSLFAALLSQHNDVIAICRKPHADAINRDGLAVQGKQNFTAKLCAFETVPNTPVDLIIIATKAYDVKNAIHSAAPLTNNNTYILTLQNGFGSHQQIPNKLKTILATTTYAAQFISPGVVNFTGTGETTIGHSTISEAVASGFNTCGIRTTISPNIEKEIWKKVVINCGINALGALHKKANGQLLEDPETRQAMRALVQEALTALSAAGITFNEDLVDTTFQTAELTHDNRNSMLQDIEAGRRTEVGYINGAIVALGKEHGIPTPLNAEITRKVKEMAV